MTKKPLSSPRQAEVKARTSLKFLKAGLRMAAKHPEKESSIHDLRVAIRRFKQVLRVFAAYFDHTRKMRRSLRGVMELCGAARNCDVALEVLESAGVPADRDLRRDLKTRRVRATRRLAATLADWRIRSHVRREWLTAKTKEGPASKPASSEISPDFLKSGAAAASAAAAYVQMHKFRLLVKKMRYTSEILGASEAQLNRLRGLQDRLGAINDCVTTADLISETDLPAADRRRIKAALNSLLAQRTAEFRIYWRTEYGPKRGKRRTG